MNITTRLINWYKKHGRDLPWRNTTDPYKILVSEIMLQQTQVDRVTLYYTAWIKQFPDFTHLASASKAEVIHAWSGLGYNRRALALRDIAKQVQTSGIPKDREAWMQLKGVGPYTSAAVALFSSEEKVFPVDSIIRRVGGRIMLGSLFAKQEEDALIERAGRKLLNETKAYQDIPQALFDLGSKICSKDPKCTICPLKSVCKAAPKFLSGKVTIPKRSINKGKERIYGKKKYPDRIYRGRILKLLTSHPKGIAVLDIPKGIDPSYKAKQDREWFEAIIDRMERDGLIQKHKNNISLPK